MKIESAAAYMYHKTYSATAPTDVAKLQQTYAVTPKKTDKIAFSGDVSSRAELGRLSQTIASETETAVSSERIQELKAAVENNEYYVSTAQLAQAMLGTLI